MNFVQLRATHHPDLLFCDFNQDATCVSVGSSSGCRLYRCHPLELIYEQEAGGSLGVVEMLFGTSLLATVGGGDQPAFSPRTLRMWNTKSGKALCELNFDAPIIGVRLNKKRVAVVLQHRIGVFDLNTMESLQSLATVHNPKGLCALSPNAENCFLVFPKATDKGDLIVYDALSLNVKNVFKAHVSPIAAMAISSNGRLLATASETGTLIRVFSLPAGTRQYVFRRGSSSASISCLSFSQDGHFLVAAGSTQTIHVYKLDDSSAKPSAMASVIDGVVSSAMSLGGVIEGERDFARIRVRSSGVACLCAITSGRVGQRRVARPSSIAAADGGAAAAAAAAATTTGQVVSAAGGDADASGAASDGGSGGGAGSATATTTTATSTAVTSDSAGGGTASSSTAGTATSSGDAGGAGRGGATGAGAGAGAGGGAGAGAGAGVGAGDSDNGTTGSSGSGAGSSTSKSPAATAGPSAATGSSAAKADEPIRYYATVVTSDGVVSQYLLDTEKGGDCKLQHEHVLARSASEAIGSAVLS